MTLSAPSIFVRSVLSASIVCASAAAYADDAPHEHAEHEDRSERIELEDATHAGHEDAEARTDGAHAADRSHDADGSHDADDDAVANDPRIDIGYIPSVYSGGGGFGAASSKTTRHTFQADMDLKFRVQPLAIVLSTRMYNEMEYMRNNVGMLFSPVFFRAGAVVNFSPAFAEGGLDLEWAPIRILSVRAQYVATYNFGTFKYIIPFDNPNPVTRDDEMAALADSARSGVSQRVEISPTLQVALGNIAVRNTFNYARMWYPSGDFQGPYVRESSYDRIISTDGDAVLSNLIVVLYKVWDPDGSGDAQAYIGPFHEWARGVDTQDNRHRIGLTGVLVPKNNYGRVYRPRLLLQAGYNIVDRENGRRNRAFVQGALGFTLRSK